jgi:signal transduction histidine kinase
VDTKLIYDLNIVLAYGITFGIVIMTIVYTFVRYIYSKDIFYISYCLTQFFSLVFIVSSSKLFNIPHLIEEFSLLLATLSSLVFAINFYEGKFFPKLETFKELVINTIILNIIILTAFYHYMLFEYLPYTIIYAILFISVAFNLKDGFKANFAYVIGWSIFCFVVFIFDFKTYYEHQGFMDLVLVAFAIEAILFTLSLAYKYNSLQKQNKSIEDMLLQQSRLAKSGEMIENITHQFRQPLNNISYILINFKKRFENKKLDSKYFEKKLTQANEQLDFLSKTIDDFKEFYAPSKKKEYFSIKEVIENVSTILSADLKKRNIQVFIDFKVSEEIKIFGIKNELSQVLLALISNANDALKDTENPMIKIEVDSTSAEVIIKIIDNAGGIKKRDLDKIFEPYFTTKENGSGIGLYLTKVIIRDSFNGKIEVANNKEGAVFSLFIEKAI